MPAKQNVIQCIQKLWCTCNNSLSQTSFSMSQTNVGLFDGWRIIDTIASHSNHIALALTCLNDQQLLMRYRPSKDNVLMVQDYIVELHERHVCQVSAVHDDR